MTFTDRCWAASEPVYRAILDHPFLPALADGSLPSAAFAYYLAQDAHYLIGYGQVLAALGARARDPEDTALFARHAAGAIEVERTLHARLLDDLGVGAERAAATPVSPTTLAYLSYLRASVAFGGYLEALAAVLPCYWIYQKVGERLSAAGSPNPGYQRWIDAYADPAFGSLVAEALAAADRAASVSSDDDRARAVTAFRITSQYEWMFWDAAYRQERWPVG
jgi:thiaminase/transcriptional activator TenA